MPSRFHELDAYRRAAALADAVFEDVARWAPFERSTIGEQLVRAVDSIGANIAEANGRWTAADKRRFLLYARGSLYETEHWLTRAKARNITDDDYANELASVARPLNGLLKQPTP
jgi:four helix bundle protein